MREYGNDTAGGRSGPRRSASGRVQPAMGPGPATEGDLGIMRTLGSMGSAAKRSLTQLAQSFNSNSSTANQSGHYPTGNTSQGSTQYVSRGGTAGGSAATSQPQVRRRRGSGGGRRKGAFNDLEDVRAIIYPAYMCPQMCKLISSAKPFSKSVLGSFPQSCRTTRRAQRSSRSPAAAGVRNTCSKRVPAGALDRPTRMARRRTKETRRTRCWRGSTPTRSSNKVGRL
jgi:hypothetical protein